MGNTASVVRRLCPINVAPDGVTCTFAYEILGWVTIDDLDGISNESLVGGKYANFTEWFEASEDNIEFAGDVQTGEMEEGLDFWKNPRDEEANKERAANVVELYNDIVSGKFVSSMLYDVFVKKFKPLPTPEELAAQNPKCYESVKSCAGGCVRTGYSQLCTPCQRNTTSQVKMKIATILLTASAALVNAQEPGIVRPLNVAASSVTYTADKAVDATLSGSNTTTHNGEWHMKPVRVVHARVQSDTPKYYDTFFGSAYGKDAENGYLSSLDSVNTASVEGALMYVQAECINQNSRSKEDRCVRKNKVRNIVFYEVLIAQTNETIAQYQENWNAPEYGPFLAMDSGLCTPQGDNFPPECLMFNGEDGYPNIGPYVGAGTKKDDPRAPYPDTYWYSFPNTCPTKAWAEKTDDCRASTRKGLCPVGVAPDGVECTFSYDILGWVTIDDVVGITEDGKYANFTEWCEASEENVEFAGDDKTGEMEGGLDFWKDPTDPEANKARAAKVVEVYNDMVSGKFVSSMIDAETVAKFKPLPTPEELAAQNPKCYENVKSCSGGCARTGYSQLCKSCQAGESGCEAADSAFAFPALEKAKTEKPEEELVSSPTLSGSSSTADSTAGGSVVGPSISKTKTPAPSSASSVYMGMATVAAAAVAALAL
ncbi:hypothetical protein Poli38472_014479 [Pythium oligandrum]|uniref:Uncharacterized protein n=1 Tax=Pythium oligandrum TaxID=41045 RepID=A0A8K1FJS4_PYTOL|nr:hypothetical protein Poli38472_014479 [Pythium oligandrum]|eukprot:TMW61018.1 hypothetical protein Poli38472_014479 [Pythium oligandrum]